MTGLLIAGGLTIDRFADGRSAPGGSVLHAGLAAREEGERPTFLTVAGDEPHARDGLARLAEIGPLHRQPSAATTSYRHEEEGGRRVLLYEAASGPIDPASFRDLPASDVLLLAPIADELPATAVATLRDAVRPRLTMLLIQGWLRRLEIGRAVHPLRLEELTPGTWSSFAAADALVVSTEDLAEAPGDPFAQARELRSGVGARPLIVLTLGPQGYLLDDPAADRVVASVPRRVVAGVPSVGAGDTFGAAMAIHLARGGAPDEAASAATERVITMLERRGT